MYDRAENGSPGEIRQRLSEEPKRGLGASNPKPHRAGPERHRQTANDEVRNPTHAGTLIGSVPQALPRLLNDCR